jgi:hypothetical protein
MLTIKNQILLTHSAEDWDLYTISNARECAVAADAMNRALMEAVNAGKTHHEVVSAVMPVFQQYSDLGACDSEPMGTLDRILDEIFTRRRR